MSARYTAIVLNEESQNQLLAEFHDLYNQYLFPIGFTDRGMHGRLGHHMTLGMGPCRRPELLGKEFLITVNGFGISDKAVAARVGNVQPVGEVPLDIYVDSGVPHITLFLNSLTGSRPKDSKYIQTWLPTRTGLEYYGVVREVL